MGSAGGADVPIATGVHADLTGGRALEEGLGHVRELWIAMREPSTHRVVLALGASIPHHETVRSRWVRGRATGRGRPGSIGGDVPPSLLDGSYVIAPGPPAPSAADAGRE